MRSTYILSAPICNKAVTSGPMLRAGIVQKACCKSFCLVLLIDYITPNERPDILYA